MKVDWGTQDMAAWDRAHAAGAAPLQQDWAYGSTLVSLGARVLRAIQRPQESLDYWDGEP